MAIFGKKAEPVNPLKEIISRHLLEAEKLLKQRRFDEAKFEVDYVLQTDPRNYYARSLSERLRPLLKQAEDDVQGHLKAEADTMDRKLQVVAELLKEAEKFIEARQYQRALDQVAKVFSIDPQNYFAQAYSERIDILMKEQAAPQKPPQGMPSLRAAAPARPSQMPPPMTKPAAPPLPIFGPKPAASPAAPKPFAPPHPPPPRTAPIPQAPPAPKAPPVTATPATASDLPWAVEARIAMYKEMLREMWFDGALKEDELRELKRVRDQFKITDAEHDQAEREVKVDAYIEALRVAWRDGGLSDEERHVLDSMRKKYSISLEEHLSAEARILWARTAKASKGTLLIADDDRTLLLAISARLKEHGYTVLTSETVEKALEILEKKIPSLILSDLMFEESDLDGFEFYRRVRLNPKLNEIPFLLMSGISDEFVVRAGIRMGLDDFLTKPLNFELLLATIEGKLKT